MLRISGVRGRHRGRSGATIFFVGMASMLSEPPAMAQSGNGGGDIAYGEYLAYECVTCHQRSGAYNGIPSITGWPVETFEAVINSYRWKDRESPIMQTIAGRLSDAEIGALAAYFHSLGTPVAEQSPPMSGPCPGAAGQAKPAC